MRRLFILSCFILISTVLASTTLERVSLQLKWRPAFQFAGYYIAKQKGFYRDAGLNVTIKDFNHRDAVNDVVNGKTTYGIDDSSIILDKSNGAPVVALAAIFQHSPLALMTLKSSGITKIANLKDKKIMATKEFFKNPYIKAMFYANMINPNNLQKIPITFT
ncbi:MAG: ABC transporter substrate-binding protein, partial [Epsilonproteobacteria bacterium]|nr:ABC transporter substrate-binding protein [Campylobacterota bacterium]